MSDFDLFDDYEADQPATLEEERPAAAPRPRRNLSAFDFVAGLFALATIGAVIWTVLLIQNPFVGFNPFPPVRPEPTATLFSLTQPATAPPTWTASPSPTFGPSPTPLATSTPTNTPKPTATGVTPPPGSTNTPSVYPFTLQDETPVFARHQGAEGCAWQSIAGQVFDLQGNGVPGLPVQVTGDEVVDNPLAFTGTADAYGESGYEVFLSDTPKIAEYVVRLLSTTGMPLSEPIIVRTDDSCERNVAIVNFVQNHPLSP